MLWAATYEGKNFPAFFFRQPRNFLARKTYVLSLILMKMTLNVNTRTGSRVERWARAFTMAHETDADGRQERMCCLQETHACPSVFDSRTMSAYHCPAAVASLIILKQEGHSVTLNVERKRLPGYRGNGPEEIFKDTVQRCISKRGHWSGLWSRTVGLVSLWRSDTELWENRVLVNIGGAIELMCYLALEYQHFTPGFVFC